MPIAPGKQREVLAALRLQYENAETVILARIANIMAGGPDDLEQWAQLKLRDIRSNLDRVNKIIEQIDINETVAKAVTDAYLNGVALADADLAQHNIEITSSLATTNRASLTAFVSAATGNLEQANLMILRSVNDVYRRIISETAGLAVSGSMTRRQATQVALNRFADAGISGFVDARGRHWSMASYAEMSTRAAVVQASVEGHVDRLSAHGQNLVIVSDHTRECPLCRPWEGKVLSTDGLSPDHPTLAQATAAGLFHPGCGHTIGIYIDGVTEVPTKTNDAAGYAAQQKQRHNERQIRRWKKRQAVAITDEEKANAGRMVRRWQERQRELIASTDLRRKYEREQIRD